jgi:murein DD-endopeptidase MepM/ murein hydrolase activator NlpD
MRIRGAIVVASGALLLSVGGHSALASSCPPVGAVGILLPHARPLVLKTARKLASAKIAYPANGSVFTASSLQLESSCTSERPAAGTARVTSISLFDGAVTADAASINLADGSSSVTGLHANDNPVELSGGHATKIGNWGFVLPPDPSASYRSAFEVELSTPHDGLPTGTLIFVPYADIPLAPSAPVVPTPPPKPRLHLPLKVTPPLHGGPYTFPVSGTPDFGDTYGAFRSDVPGGWHHGDDIFAPLGTPVVAVADGTLNRVGWEKLGGWRLWVRDRNGDEFYYAHLSGYSMAALRSGRVHRGEVIGFVGNTGDAFTTLPHLHFEIHPRSLLHLQYDGAVDPTTYLYSWPRPGKLVTLGAVHPRLPRASEPRLEANQNWRELLGLERKFERRIAAASALDPGVVSLVERTTKLIPAPRRKPFAWAAFDATLAAGALAFVMARRRLRR